MSLYIGRGQLDRVLADVRSVDLCSFDPEREKNGDITAARTEFDDLRSPYARGLLRLDELETCPCQQFRLLAGDQHTLAAFEKLPEDLEVNVRTGGVMLPTDVTFPSGKATILDAVKPKLRKLADAIGAQDPSFHVYVDGYTDRQPIKYSGKENPDNWFLGARRAHAVMVFLRDQCGLPQERFVLTSYGYLNEIEPDKVKSAKNRRVEVRLVRPGVMTPAE